MPQLHYGEHVLDALVRLGDSSVHAICTSPPYWALRDYGVDPQEWEEVAYAPLVGLPEVVVEAQQVALGLEPRPEDYIGHMVAVFRELARVLRDDGICWLNIGDTYVSTNGYLGYIESGGRSHRQMNEARKDDYGGQHYAGRRPRHDTGLVPKNLVLVPHRLALALQADGWCVRNDVVWSKPDAAPESVRDRSWRSHETIFMLTRQRYYRYHPCTQRRDSTVWHEGTASHLGGHFATWPRSLVEPMIRMATSDGGCCERCGEQSEVVRDRYEPRCGCEAPLVPCTVLDPFAGSGTTGEVAAAVGREYIGIDLQDEYREIAESRMPGSPFVATKVDGEPSVFDLFGK